MEVVVRQVLVTFEEEASEAEVEAYVLTIRQLRRVARVEFLSEVEAGGLSRRPTSDANPDVTVRGDDMFFKGPDGALLARLKVLEAEIVHLLTKRRRAGLPPIKSRDTLLAELRELSPGVWKGKSVTSATDAYAGAREQLIGTEWELVDKPRGTYGFRGTAG